MELINKFNIGDMVNAKNYGISNGTIISIEHHLNSDHTEVYCVDYDVLCVGDVVEHLSEEHLTKV